MNFLTRALAVQKCYSGFGAAFIPKQGDLAMTRVKRPAKRKRSRTALPVLGAAGVSLAMTGGALAAAPAEKAPAPGNAQTPVITLGEEELSDVSLSTFFVFDREGRTSQRSG